MACVSPDSLPTVSESLNLTTTVCFCLKSFSAIAIEVIRLDLTSACLGARALLNWVLIFEMSPAFLFCMAELWNLGATALGSLKSDDSLLGLQTLCLDLSSSLDWLCFSRKYFSSSSYYCLLR